MGAKNTEEELKPTVITFRVEGEVRDVDEINKLGRKFVEETNKEVTRQAGRKLPRVPFVLPVDVHLPMFIMEYKRIDLGCDIVVKLPISAKMRMLSFVVKKVVRGRKKILKRYFKDNGIGVIITAVKD